MFLWSTTRTSSASEPSATKLLPNGFEPGESHAGEANAVSDPERLDSVHNPGGGIFLRTK